MYDLDFTCLYHRVFTLAAASARILQINFRTLKSTESRKGMDQDHMDIDPKVKQS